MTTHPSHWHMGGWTLTGRRSRCGGPDRECAHGRDSGCEAVCKGFVGSTKCGHHAALPSFPPPWYPPPSSEGHRSPRARLSPAYSRPRSGFLRTPTPAGTACPRLACSGRQPGPPPAGKCADSSPRLPPPARRPRAAARCWSWTCPCSPSAASRARTALACPSGWSTPTSTDRPGWRPLNATCWPVRKGRASVRALRSRARTYTCAPTV